MASWTPSKRVELKLHDDEASDLRELLCQTARPGSLQSRLIQRLDAALEEATRIRIHRR